ncbi:MAG TPA: aspartate--ammonia ligase, partial [Clostridiaceae bacterium]|nr:aspartate--ammonia ligase [Clostridiaceae bacterium]
LDTDISREVFFITAQQLEDMYPDLTSKEREDAIVRQHKTVFIMQIGKTLKSGQKHDGRAPDYDDWELNGDILMYNEVLDSALEISSMGIRVDSESLARQLKLSGCEDRKELMFHKMLLNNELPLSIGGGIGQSRLCMLLLKKAHIGEVQVSIWDRDTIEACKEAKVILL